MSKWWFILTLMLSLGAAVRGDDIRLLRVASSDDAAVTLDEVAMLDGDYVAQFADLPIARFEGDAQELTVSLDAVRAALGEREVHWGRIALGGYQQCAVERFVAQPSTPTIQNPPRPIELDTALTIRQRVIDWLVAHTGVARDRLVIDFAESDRDVLSRSALGETLEITPLTNATVGRMPLVIRRWRDGEPAGEDRVIADVAQRTLAVVLTRNMSRDETVGRHDVEVQEVLLRDAHGEPVTRLDDVVGRAAVGMMRDGQIIHEDDVRSPTLVRRGELIEVRGAFGGIAVKLVARAREDGAAGQIIMVRRSDTRDDFPVRVTGQRRGVTVQLNETDGKVAAR
jgi:flagella basal body P-ring formation protein FlgA